MPMPNRADVNDFFAQLEVGESRGNRQDNENEDA